MKSLIIGFFILFASTLLSQRYSAILGDTSPFPKGDHYVLAGYQAGINAGVGNANVFIGNYAGQNNSGGNNIFIGNQAGFQETNLSYKLIIESNPQYQDNPLIWGDFHRYGRKVGINTNKVPTGYTLAINGKIITEGVRIHAVANWPDYVFEEDYQLKDLKVLETEIKELGHLPNVPSAKEVKKEGIDAAEMSKILLKKIEQLTLYKIAYEKKLKLREKRIRALELLLKNQQNRNF